MPRPRRPRRWRMRRRRGANDGGETEGDGAGGVMRRRHSGAQANLELSEAQDPWFTLRAPRNDNKQNHRRNAMKLTQQQIDDFNREGWLFLPELFSPEEVALSGARGRGHLRHRAPRGVAREERRAAHRLCRPSLQRGVRPARRASAHDRSDRADLRRKGLHAPVQDQRQIGLHRRRLAMAPGLRHLEARRRHAASRAR